MICAGLLCSQLARVKRHDARSPLLQLPCSREESIAEQVMKGNKRNEAKINKREMRDVDSVEFTMGEL